MFFLIRSFFCIGLVVAALPAPRDGGIKPAALASGAALGVEQLCRTDPVRCMAIVAALGDAPGPPAAVAKRLQALPSRDTLTADDRNVRWAKRVTTLD